MISNLDAAPPELALFSLITINIGLLRSRALLRSALEFGQFGLWPRSGLLILARRFNAGYLVKKGCPSRQRRLNIFRRG